MEPPLRHNISLSIELFQTLSKKGFIEFKNTFKAIL